MPAHPITVIVPVYGDLSTLVPCVESLLANVDQSVHSVLLVNDCGPQADDIESTLLALIDGQPGFAYARNQKNLGFVGTCNRAALELDTTGNDILLLNSDTITTPGFLEELSAVLHLSPQHGAVCPRSNNATIASLPFKLRDPSVGRTMERTATVHAALRDELPRFSIAPVAMGFCLLIRRDLIIRYGLFDEAFAPGYGEENDFCLRIREHGFASLIAHRALVFHVGGRSFVGGRREALRSAHEKLIVTRYPYYTEAVQSYIHVQRDPVDVFADALAPGDDIVRALIDVDREPTSPDLALIAEAEAASNLRCRVTVAVPDRFSARISSRFPGLNVVGHSRLDGIWDIALACTDSLSDAQRARLNPLAPRWILPAPDTRGMAAATIDLASQSPEEVVTIMLKEFSRAPVDSQLLRSRWGSITRYPDYVVEAARSREPATRRLIRRLEQQAPRPVGWLKGFARAVIGHK